MSNYSHRSDGFVTLDEALHMDVEGAYLKLDEERTISARASKVRNSRQTWLAPDADWYNDAIREFIGSVYERMAAAMQLPVDYVKKNSEALQVVHYRPFEHYHAHTDTRETMTRGTQDPTWLMDASDDLAILDAVIFEAEVMFPCCHQLQDRHKFVKQALLKVFSSHELEALPTTLKKQPCSSTSRCSMLHAMQDYLRAMDDPALAFDMETFECSTCRYATILVFLNDVPKGGHTTFPLAFNQTLLADSSLIPAETHRFSNLTKTECRPGLSIKPTKGDAILWYNYYHAESKKSAVLNGKYGIPDGVDPYSLHGGCDVLEGEKWAINLWLHGLPKRYESLSGLEHDDIPL